MAVAEGFGEFADAWKDHAGKGATEHGDNDEAIIDDLLAGGNEDAPEEEAPGEDNENVDLPNF